MTQNKKQPSNNSRKLRMALARLAKVQGLVGAINDSASSLRKARAELHACERACAVANDNFIDGLIELNISPHYHPEGAIAVLKAEVFDAEEGA